MEIYTEDKASVTSSLLLQQMVAVNFLGSNGNVSRILRNQEKTVVYLDVVPDRQKLIKLYDDVLRIKSDGVYIIPIPCVEYYIIQALCDLGVDLNFRYEWLSTVLNYVNRGKTIAKNLPPRSIGYGESFNSFEKQCKLLLNNSDFVFENKDTVKMSQTVLENSWYLSDSPYASVLTKSSILWLKYPCVVVRDNKIVVDVTLIDNYVSSYESWLRSNCKVKLPDNWWM